MLRICPVTGGDAGRMARFGPPPLCPWASLRRRLPVTPDSPASFPNTAVHAQGSRFTHEGVLRALTTFYRLPPRAHFRCAGCQYRQPPVRPSATSGSWPPANRRRVRRERSRCAICGLHAARQRRLSPLAQLELADRRHFPVSQVQRDVQDFGKRRKRPLVHAFVLVNRAEEIKLLLIPVAFVGGAAGGRAPSPRAPATIEAGPSVHLPTPVDLRPRFHRRRRRRVAGHAIWSSGHGRV